MHCEILTNVTIRGDEGKFLLLGFADFLGRLRLTHKGEIVEGPFQRLKDI